MYKRILSFFFVFRNVFSLYLFLCIYFFAFLTKLLERGVAKDHIIAIVLDNIENRDLREPLTLYRHIKKQQVKAKRAQEERPLLNTGGSFKKIIVVDNHIRLKRDNMGITIMEIRQFLLDQNSLNL